MKIALIAHDGKKADMVHFLSGFRDALHRVDIDLVATGTTGSHIEKAGFQVERLLSGPLGGDAQIAALAAEKKYSGVMRDNFQSKEALERLFSARGILGEY